MERRAPLNRRRRPDQRLLLVHRQMKYRGGVSAVVIAMLH